jgi:hypothetical protein
MLLSVQLIPGSPVYMQVQAEAPEALSAFITWVAANEAHRHAQAMAEERREAFYAVHRDDELTALWREASNVSSKMAVNLNASMQFLESMLRRAGIGNADEWARVKLSQLETRAGEKLEAAG